MEENGFELIKSQLFEEKFIELYESKDSDNHLNIIRKIIHKLSAALKLLGLIFLLRLSKILIPENSILIK